jgi:hypothetical protein
MGFFGRTHRSKLRPVVTATLVLPVTKAFTENGLLHQSSIASLMLDQHPPRLFKLVASLPRLCLQIRFGTVLGILAFLVAMRTGSIAGVLVVMWWVLTGILPISSKSLRHPGPVFVWKTTSWCRTLLKKPSPNTKRTPDTGAATADYPEKHWTNEVHIWKSPVAKKTRSRSLQVRVIFTDQVNVITFQRQLQEIHNNDNVLGQASPDNRM